MTGAEQTHEEVQQAPVQGLGVHTVPGPWYISPPAHPLTPTLAQVQEVMLQQTPVHGVEQVPGLTQVAEIVEKWRNTGML